MWQQAIGGGVRLGQLGLRSLWVKLSVLPVSLRVLPFHRTRKAIRGWLGVRGGVEIRLIQLSTKLNFFNFQVR